MLTLPRDVIILPESHGRWLVMNVFSRTCLGVEGAVLDVLSLSVSSPEHLKEKFSDKNFKVWAVGYFSNVDGLMADPSGYVRDTGQWPSPEVLKLESLLTKLQKYFILISNEAEYKKSFSAKTSLLDYVHFGNFHQRLGQELLVKKCFQPENWWLKQKFNDDLKSVKNNLYGAIQAKFLEGYFRKRISKDRAVLDVGCGIGFYTHQMARYGKEVWGVDPNKDFIRVAKENALPNARFDAAAVGQKNALDLVGPQWADIVFMSDALLFYFVSPNPQEKATIQILLNDIRRILKPDGVFISVEPHYLFWLLPWLGDVERPFTVLTEYRTNAFRVTPPFSTFVQTLTQNGFCLTSLNELTPDPSFEAVDPRAYHFASQFPLWQLSEWRPISDS